jgi:hypothetical protein
VGGDLCENITMKPVEIVLSRGKENDGEGEPNQNTL